MTNMCGYCGDSIPEGAMSDDFIAETGAMFTWVGDRGQPT